jgi:hypothetical protein
VMRDRRLPWLLSLPLMAAGCLGAHSVAYRLFEPSGAEVGHGYLALAPLALAIGIALGIVTATRSALTGPAQTAAPVRLFALLPALAFILQEHLERAFHGGTVLETMLEPVFLVGLALQLPLALCSFLVARALLHVAEAASALLCRRPTLPLRHPVVRRPSFVFRDVRASALASQHAGRAPPEPA